MLKIIIRIFVVILLCVPGASAQVTTSSMSGFVKSVSGEALAGASVTATHVPTGSIYKTQTSKNGTYSLDNINPGGPYVVEVSYVGLSTQKKSEIYLVLGETFKNDFSISQSATDLAEVIVSAPTKPDPGKGGTSTTISRERIETMPTVGRTLTDYLRATPQLKLASGGFATNEGGFSLGGQNVRFNSFYVDGAVSNDVFGLAYSGTNGGQSSVSPLSIDAIDQLQVILSPYDASIGNFTGGAINAITKSGTNDVHGSAYYIFRNQNMAGKTPIGNKDAATKLNKFSNKTFGATVGGPIIKNKLFYFISVELQRDETPNPVDTSTYQGDNPSAFESLRQAIIAKGGGYDPGGIFDSKTELTSDKVVVKLDWNANPKNKVSASYRYTGGDRKLAFASTPTEIDFSNYGYQFPTTTHSASLELKTTIGNSSSNRLLATFTDVKDDRGPLGSTPFPNVQIFDGRGSFRFGTESNSTFNYLKQSTYNLSDQFKFTKGIHTFTTGFEAEYYKAFNSFISNTTGSYQYDSVAAFIRDLKPRQYTVGFPLLGSNDETSTDAAAKFNVFRGAIFLNDEIKVNPRLSFSVGIRADYNKFITKPIVDQFAVDSALPKFAQYYDLKGGVPGKMATVPVSISPRIGFTYKVPKQGLVFRGGAGLFTGRIPMVWPGGIYNNNGISSGSYVLSASTNTALWNQDRVRFRTTPYSASEVGVTTNNVKGQLNIISKEFKVPKVFRTSLAVDKNFGQGWSVTVEGMYTKNINEIFYQNINLLPPTLRSAGPDNRTVYGTLASTSNTIPIRSNGTNPYSSGAFLLTNLDSTKGYSYNLTFILNKTTRTGFSFYGSYNYGISYVVNESQSSTTNSQWGSQESINGRNYITRSISDNSAEHRVFAFVSKKFTYANGNLATTLGFTYNGQSGSPYSFVYNGQAVRDGQNFQDLIFVPTAQQLTASTFTTITPLTPGGPTYTPDQQKAALESYIQNDDYLKTRRGQYAERNASRLPFTNVVDMRLAQDFSMKFGSKRYAFQVIYSMFNFGNFLNRDWGHQYFVASDQAPAAINVSYAPGTLNPRYQFNPTTVAPGSITTTTTPTYASRWTSQLELRVRF